MKRKRLWIALAVVLAILLIPVPSTLKDGGTKVYTAVLYRIVIWHQLDEDVRGGYRTGTEFEIFPFHFLHSI